MMRPMLWQVVFASLAPVFLAIVVGGAIMALSTLYAFPVMAVVLMLTAA